MPVKLLKKGMKGEEVKHLQLLLQKNLGLKEAKFRADGDFGKLTDKWTRVFQKKAKLSVDGKAGPATFGALAKKGNSKSRKFAESIAKKAPKEKKNAKEGAVDEDPIKKGTKNITSGLDKLSKVNSGLQKKAKLFAAEYGPCKISSGLRTVKKQAELMAPMTDKGLNMYGTTSWYVVEIKKLAKKDRTTKKVEEILNKAVKAGSRISWHLKGKAVDFSMKGGFDMSKADKIAKKLGLKVKHETWRNCYHVNL